VTAVAIGEPKRWSWHALPGSQPMPGDLYLTLPGRVYECLDVRMMALRFQTDPERVRWSLTVIQVDAGSVDVDRATLATFGLYRWPGGVWRWGRPKK
jgi:hypothetical protein